MVGTGPDSDALKAHFAGTKTVLTGVMTGEALSQAFASADVFVMPSDSETLGFVVLESMASGVPVVGADAGGIPDLIDDGQVGRFAGAILCVERVDWLWLRFIMMARVMGFLVRCVFYFWVRVTELFSFVTKSSPSSQNSAQLMEHARRTDKYKKHETKMRVRVSCACVSCRFRIGNGICGFFLMYSHGYEFGSKTAGSRL